MDHRVDLALPRHRGILAARGVDADAHARPRPRKRAHGSTIAPGLPSPLPHVVRLRHSRLRVGAGDLLVDDRQADPYLTGSPAAWLPSSPNPRCAVELGSPTPGGREAAPTGPRLPSATISKVAIGPFAHPKRPNRAGKGSRARRACWLSP